MGLLKNMPDSALGTSILVVFEYMAKESQLCSFENSYNLYGDFNPYSHVSNSLSDDIFKIITYTYDRNRTIVLNERLSHLWGLREKFALNRTTENYNNILNAFANLEKLEKLEEQKYHELIPHYIQKYTVGGEFGKPCKFYPRTLNVAYKSWEGFINELKRIWLQPEKFIEVKSQLKTIGLADKLIINYEYKCFKEGSISSFIQSENGSYQLVNVWKKLFQQLKDNNDPLPMEQEENSFASKTELDTILTANKGIYVGGGYHFNGDGHMLTIGGSGAGKGVNFIIPALLSPALVASGSSVVVLDPKGENLAICGEHLKRNGYKVLAINPFNIPEISGFIKAGFNPFSLTSKDDINAPKFCDLVAECLIPDAGASSAHWTDSARQYISLYLLYMVVTEQANFQNLFEAVRLGGDDRLRYLQKMRDCSAFGGIISATAGGIAEQLIQGGGSTEIDSIYSTIRRGTDIFKDFQLREHLEVSDFDLTQLAHEKTALFVCVNPAELQLFSGWLRVFFGCVFRTLQKYYNPNRRVLMILDEFPQIGRLKEFEMAVAYMRGYNVTIWAIVQDLSQLKKLYWDSWETFVGSASVKMWLPQGGDNFTLDYLEKRLPIKEKTFFDISKFKPDTTNVYDIYQKNREPLMTKNDLIMCKDCIVEVRGLTKIARFEKIPYWLLSWAKNASPNPFRK